MSGVLFSAFFVADFLGKHEVSLIFLLTLPKVKTKEAEVALEDLGFVSKKEKGKKFTQPNILYWITRVLQNLPHFYTLSVI